MVNKVNDIIDITRFNNSTTMRIRFGSEETLNNFIKQGEISIYGKIMKTERR